MNPDLPQPDGDPENPVVHVMRQGSSGVWRMSRRDVVQGAAASTLLGSLTSCKEPPKIRIGKWRQASPTAKAHQGPVHDMVVIDTYLYSCGADGIKKWYLSDYIPLEQHPTLPDGIYSWRALAAHHSTLIAGSLDHPLIGWNTWPQTRPVTLTNQTLKVPRNLCWGGSDEVSAVIDLETHQSEDQDGRLVLLNPGKYLPDDIKPLQRLADDEKVRALAIFRGLLPQALGVVKSRTPNTVSWFTLDTKIQESNMATPLKNITVLAFSFKKRTLAVGSLEGGICFLSVQSDQVAGPVGASLIKVTPSAKITCMEFADDNSLFAAGCADGHLHVIEPTTGNIVRVIPAHQGRITAVRFCKVSNQRCVATCGEDGCIRIWDPDNGSLLAAMELDEKPKPLTATPTPYSPPTKTTPVGGGSTYYRSGSHYWRPN